MPMINLIQERRNFAKQSEHRARGFFFAFVGASVLSVGAFGVLYLDTESLKSEVATLRRQMTKIQPILSEIERNKKEMDGLGPRLTTLQNAQDSTRRWSRILEHLSTNSPDGLWLTQMRCTQTNPTEPVSMSLTGMSVNQDSVAEFLLRLKSCTDLEATKLKYTQGDFSGDKSGIKFDISADIPGTAGPKPKTKKEQGKE